MSTLIKYMQLQADEKSRTLLAYYYCDFSSPETRDPLNLVGSLLAQICFDKGSYPQSLESACDRCKMSGSSDERRISIKAITEIFLEIAAENEVAILVDGVDELEKRQDILDFLKAIGTDRALMKILVSSRDEFDIREAFSQLPRMCLETASATLNHDIDSYIDHRLTHGREFKLLKESFQQTIRQRLSKEAKGM